MISTLATTANRSVASSFPKLERYPTGWPFSPGAPLACFPHRYELRIVTQLTVETAMSLRSGLVRRSLLKSLALTLVAAATGCGGGGGGSPTAPSPPTPSPTNISGAWTGTSTTTAVSGTCLADTATAGGLPFTLSSDWVVQQAGSSISVSRTINHVLTCAFTGTIQGSTFSLRYDFSNSPPACGPSLETVCTVPRFRIVRLEFQLDQSAHSGTVSGSTITMNGTGISKVYDARSGEYLGEFESRGVDELRR